MKALFFSEQGSLSNLRYGDFPDPDRADDELRIRVRAAALNGFEPMILLGTTGLKTPLPMIPCGDVAGEIESIGPAVTDRTWRVGDRVLIEPFAGTKMMGETALGGACEWVCTTADRLIRIPDGVSFEAASCLQIAYGTAHRMIVHRGRVREGEIVLVLGATGGVGVACVQLARRAGAFVVACGGNETKLARLRALGAHELIDTSRQSFQVAIEERFGRARVLGEGGVDIVVNYIGGATWPPSLRCLKKGGRLLVCGATAGFDVPTDLRHVWSFERSIVGSDGWTRDDTLALLELARSGELPPVIDSVRPLHEGPQALVDLHARRIFGKVVLTPDAEVA